MGLYESIMFDKYTNPFKAPEGMSQKARYSRTSQPEYGVAEATPRITRELQFRTMSGQLSEKIFVVSSNVVSMSYNAERQQLTVEFQRWVKGVGRVIGGGARYLYNNITLEEWKSAKVAGSKGKWVWAVLRRGGKPYMRIR